MISLHHVQLAMPADGAEAARAYWAGAIGLVEVEQPSAIRPLGGCWFRAIDGDRVTAEVHVGIEQPFSPARKAHPALVVADAEALDAVAERLRAGGFLVDESQRTTYDGYVRFHSADPFGNRVEVLAPA
ncbi:VOC family protein [Agrococcus beijingensis]|uniref:VOC family protein n=1 Tax=Agrococcus beijingensis TaxID=3068634 RepID=UPI0027409D7B|nr:VOC family protein [Agrococcus sp. REN33]